MRTRGCRSWGGAGRVVLVATLIGLAASCGRAGPDRVIGPPPPPATAAPTAERGVGATDVEIVGSLTTDQQHLVTWALVQFERADLRLPTRIEVRFETGPEACGRSLGHCRPDRDPALVRVCTGPGDTFGQLLQQRTVLLHELAHAWHWAQGDGSRWLDLSGMVGGCCDAADSEPTEERVAIAIAWGLLDQRRRPVRTDVACAVLHERFLALTGREPLGPIEPVCLRPVRCDPTTCHRMEWWGTMR